MPAPTLRVRKSTAAAVAAAAGLAIVGTFAIDSTGAANAATTGTTATAATAAIVTGTHQAGGTSIQSDALVQFQRMTAAVAKNAPAKPAAVSNAAQITDSRVLAAKAAAAKKAADAKAAAKADADRKAAAAKKAADARKAADAAAAKKAAAKQQAAAAPSGSPQQIAAQIVPAGQLASFSEIIFHESGWNVEAVNPSSGSYGLGQALPASKMASEGADWRTNPVTQIKWALNYMDSRYGSPNAAWQFWQAHNWY